MDKKGSPSHPRWFTPSLAVYIHYPFCLRKCRYCAFASRAAEPQDLTELYLKELSAYPKREVSSVYFGGGTPSLMSVESVAKLLARLRPSGEVTLEANPATIDKAKMRALRAAGVNRLSVGVQSLDDSELQFLGRVHTARQALETLDAAREAFDNINADFIYGLPGQSVSDWARSLEKIAALDLPHYSLYQLTHEKGTPIGKLAPIDEDVAAKMFSLAPKVLRQYEVSNFARPGFEGQHNLNYWRGGEYIGLGPGAAGRVRIDGKWYETKNPSSLPHSSPSLLSVFNSFIPGLERSHSAHCKLVAQTKLCACPAQSLGFRTLGLLTGRKLKPGLAGKEDKNLSGAVVRLSNRSRAREMVISGLRMNAGIDFATFKENSGIDFWNAVDRAAAAELLLAGKRGARVPAKLRPVLDSVIREIVI